MKIMQAPKLLIFDWSSTLVEDIVAQDGPIVSLIEAKNLEAVLKFCKTHKISANVLSNKHQASLEKEVSEVKDFDMWQYFDKIVGVSGQISKPSLESLLIILHALEIEFGKHIWIIGDTLEKDMKLANVSASTGILYNPEGNFIASMTGVAMPDVIIHSMSDLLSLLQNSPL